MSSHDAEMSRQQRARQDEVARNDQALLVAARRVFSRDGVHASVGAIAEAAGVGVGTLYRRYESKTALFERLLVLSNEQWAAAVSRAHAATDPWRGLSTLVTESIEYGQGTLAALGRLVHVPTALNDLMTRADEEFRELVSRAHAGGSLAADVTADDVILLIEQYARSPLVEQITALNDPELLMGARTTRRRLIAIALNGLRRHGHDALPTPAPTPALLTARWAGPDR